MFILTWDKFGPDVRYSPIGDPVIDVSQGTYLFYQMDLTSLDNTCSELDFYPLFSIDGIHWDTEPIQSITIADNWILCGRTIVYGIALKFVATHEDAGKYGDPVFRCFLR